MSIPPAEWDLPANAEPEKKRKHRQQMIAWLHNKLDWEHDAMEKRANSKENCEKFERLAFGDGTAIDEAKRGNIEPLRRQYPHLAEFLHLPRGHRGRSPKLLFTISVAKLAAEDVRHVRKFWREQYNRSRRKTGDPLAAEAVVAAYYAQMDIEVTPDDIKAVKKSGKHKTPRSK